MGTTSGTLRTTLRFQKLDNQRTDLANICYLLITLNKEKLKTKDLIKAARPFYEFESFTFS